MGDTSQSPEGDTPTHSAQEKKGTAIMGDTSQSPKGDSPTHSPQNGKGSPTMGDTSQSQEDDAPAHSARKKKGTAIMGATISPPRSFHLPLPLSLSRILPQGNPAHQASSALQGKRKWSWTREKPDVSHVSPGDHQQRTCKRCKFVEVTEAFIRTSYFGNYSGYTATCEDCKSKLDQSRDKNAAENLDASHDAPQDHQPRACNICKIVQHPEEFFNKRYPGQYSRLTSMCEWCKSRSLHRETSAASPARPAVEESFPSSMSRDVSSNGSFNGTAKPLARGDSQHSIRSVHSTESRDIEVSEGDEDQDELDESENQSVASDLEVRPQKNKNGQRVYCTGFPPCYAGFNGNWELARHIRTHTGELPYQCHCSRRFARLDSLKQHARRMHANEEIPDDSPTAQRTTIPSSVSTSPATSHQNQTGEDQPPQQEQHSHQAQTVLQERTLGESRPLSETIENTEGENNRGSILGVTQEERGQ